MPSSQPTVSTLINSSTCGWPIDPDRVSTILDRAVQLLGGNWDSIGSVVITEEQADAIMTGRELPAAPDQGVAQSTAVRLVAQSGGYGPWYGVAGYRQSRTVDNRRVWESTGSTGRLSAHRARLTGLQYGSLHARAVDESTPLPDGVSSIDMLPRFRK